MTERETWVDTFSQTLAHCHLFEGVDRDKLHLLARGATRVDYEMETTLWDVGTRPDHPPEHSQPKPHEVSCVAYIMSGRLVMMRDGWVVGLLRAGDIIGVSGAISLVPHTATVVAATGASLIYLNQRDFRDTALHDMRILQNAVRVLGERIGRMNDMIVSLHRLPPRKEQVFNLLLLLEQGGAVIESRGEMAKLIGADRATVSRAISELMQDKRVERIGEALSVRRTATGAPRGPRRRDAEASRKGRRGE